MIYIYIYIACVSICTFVLVKQVNLVPEHVLLQAASSDDKSPLRATPPPAPPTLGASLCANSLLLASCASSCIRASSRITASGASASLVCANSPARGGPLACAGGRVVDADACPHPRYSAASLSAVATFTGKAVAGGVLSAPRFRSHDSLHSSKALFPASAFSH